MKNDIQNQFSFNPFDYILNFLIKNVAIFGDALNSAKFEVCNAFKQQLAWYA